MIIDDNLDNLNFIVSQHHGHSSRLLPKKILKGPSELNVENLGAQHMK